jgi:hypothetical protein
MSSGFHHSIAPFSGYKSVYFSIEMLPIDRSIPEPISTRVYFGPIYDWFSTRQTQFQSKLISDLESA